MATVRVCHNGLRIVVESPFAYKDAVASVPTREWDPKNRVWHFEPYPWVALRLVGEISRVAGTIGDDVHVDDRVRLLSSRAVAVDTASGPLLDIRFHRQAGSKLTPWRHQFIGSRLIRNLDAVYLAWEMGTGKTKAVIDAILDLHSSGPRKVLIVCPVPVVDVWEMEFAKHVEDSDTRFVIAASRHRAMKKRVEAAECAIERAAETGRTAVVVVNYESFVLDGSPMLRFAENTRWSLLVADEAHRMANPGSKTSRALTSRIGPRSEKRVCLSGTPMRNTPLDLYSQCKFLDPGIFGSNQRRFLERYAVLDFFGNVVGLQNTAELAERFGLIAYRIDKRTVIRDLPPVTPFRDRIRRFDLSEEAMKIYKTFESELVVAVGRGELKASNSLVQLLRSQQMTSGFVPIDDDAEGNGRIEEIDSGKRDEAGEILDEIVDTEPVVFFCRFRRDLDTVANLAKERGRRYFELSGRVNELRAWQQDTSGSVIGIQIQSGGVGVDATRASYAVFYSVGFSLSDYEQAVSRLDRPGQKNPVTVVNLVARGTVDEAVFGSIGAKGNVVEGVLDYLRSKIR
jgi:SNF2 family DNA or RNA helicase